MAPQTLYRPATTADVLGIVAQALAESRTLEVCGGGSKGSMYAHDPAAARLDMRAVSGITNYDPDELVLTARAGTPLLQIEAALDAHEQMLAFEPFDHAPLFGAPAGHATLGGIVAANVSGSRRIGAGAARDHVLGFAAVSGRGEALKGGGAVVKNVTGFDLPKLMTGSWGTLAVLTSITVRALPKPRAAATLLFRGLTDSMANRLMTQALALPVAVSGAAHVPGTEATTALRIEGFEPSVKAGCRELGRALKDFAGSDIITAQQSEEFWRGLRALDALPRREHVLWRISVPAARGAQAGALLRASEAKLDPSELHYVYDWAGGLVWAALPESRQALCGPTPHAIARALGGHATLIRAPQPLRAAAAAVPPCNPGLRWLQARIKAAFDPCAILNPGVDLAADL